MKAVITGDIIDSRKAEQPGQWLKILKRILGEYGASPKKWDIYRGDSFQLQVENPQCALLVALRLKAAIKQLKGLNVRMGIGIGGVSYEAERVMESQGEVFIHAGKCFDTLKKKTLALKSPWHELDEEINLYLELALLTIDNWTANSAEIVQLAIEHPHKTQMELSEMLKITQSNVSSRFRRAGYEEVMKVEKRFRKLIVHKNTSDKI
ncbi:SatD family protein [Flammeovirgaceae bacterium SG7u.111]|nr:SatD family protein [Flammeovirgaceae bacterium SG7u.132]WPO37674.1 SatD family protein [Flammeovirgaceae bacterium SG7u.111]